MLDKNSRSNMQSFEARRFGIKFASVQFCAACDKLVKNLVVLSVGPPLRGGVSDSNRCKAAPADLN